MQSDQPIPIGQHWLISRMDKLDYLADYKGICFGVAHMAMQAILLNDLKTFNARLNLINHIPSEQLINKIAAVNQTIISLHEKAKKENKEVELYLSNEERLLISIPPFLEGVSLYQKPDAYPDVFLLQPLGQQVDIVEELIRPQMLADREAKAEKIASFSNAYDETMLTKYIYGLSKLRNCDVPVAIVLESEDHAITISYDREKRLWSFTDANKLPTRFYTGVELAKNIIGAFSKNNQAVLTTNIFGEEANKDNIKNLLSEWEILESNDKSTERIKIQDSSNRTWLSLAVVEDNLPLVKELLLKNADPTLAFITKDKNNGLTPLHIAIKHQNSEMVKAMVESLLKKKNVKSTSIEDMVAPLTSVLLKSTPDQINAYIADLKNVKKDIEPSIRNNVANQIESLIRHDEIDRIKKTKNHDVKEKIKVWEHLISMVKNPVNENKPFIDIYQDWKNKQIIEGKRNIDIIQPGESKISLFYNQKKDESFVFLEKLLNNYVYSKPNDDVDKIKPKMTP
jgi:ankyrin repeat protein